MESRCPTLWFSPLAAVLLAGCTEPPPGDGALDGGGIDITGDPTVTDDDGEDEDEKLDVGAGTGGITAAGDSHGDPPCVDGETDGGAPVYEFSVIWIANTAQGTVSKIDTVTAEELARYYTGPPLEGVSDPYRDHSPSRTSVNLRGDVVVGNRGTHAPQSSFTKITGDSDSCPDRNGDGEIRTSQGPDDILPWGEDDCIEWHYPVESNTARAVAWDAGEATCENTQPANVWLGYKSWGGDVYVDLVDGESGQRIDRVEIDDPGFIEGTYGIYGGAADKDGNFWGVNRGFVFIDRETLEWRTAEGAGYGFALDPEGNPWGDWGSGRIGQTDAASGVLVDIYEGAQGGYDRGVAIDGNWDVWMVTNGHCGVARFDIETLTWVDPHITWPSCAEPVGVSIDFEGHVWIVDREAERAVKLLPNEHGQGATVVAEVTGLIEPYTYSDMTGAALNLVVNPPVPEG